MRPRSASCLTRSMRWSPRSATSRLIRKTPAAATLLARIGDALRVGALDLGHLSLELLTTGHPILPPDHQLAIDALKREAARVEAEAMDPMARAALDATTWPLVLSLEPHPASRAVLVERRDGARRDRRRRPRRVHPEAKLRAQRACPAFRAAIRRSCASRARWRWR